MVIHGLISFQLCTGYPWLDFLSNYWLSVAWYSFQLLVIRGLIFPTTGYFQLCTGYPRLDLSFQLLVIRGLICLSKYWLSVAWFFQLLVIRGLIDPAVNMTSTPSSQETFINTNADPFCPRTRIMNLSQFFSLLLIYKSCTGSLPLAWSQDSNRSWTQWPP